MDISIQPAGRTKNTPHAPTVTQVLSASPRPRDIVRWVARNASKPIISTNFRPMSIAILHLVTRILPDIPVIWVDSGYNTPATSAFANEIKAYLGLNLQIYRPDNNAAAPFRTIPEIDSEAHAAFTRAVKLEPFERALRQWQPDYWITGIRADQTAYRRTLDISSPGPFGSTRIAPLLHWTEVDVEGYIYEHQLPDYDDYLDPTKGGQERECGLQTLAG